MTFAICICVEFCGFWLLPNLAIACMHALVDKECEYGAGCNYRTNGQTVSKFSM